MPYARYQGTARLFAGRLPPEITDRIARSIHSSRVAQATQRRIGSRENRNRNRLNRWVNRARRNIGARNRVTIARIALSRRRLRNRGIIGPPGYNEFN